MSARQSEAASCSGLFIALMMNGARDGGVFYATSANLIDWSPPLKLIDGLGEGAYHCGDAPPLAYPSLLDPHSNDRNFMTVGPSAQLFLTRFNLTGCRTSMDRDLIRIPIAITASPTTGLAAAHNAPTAAAPP
jgi:hypothetical protein